MVTTKTRTMWWVVRKDYQECQNLQTKIEKVFQVEEQPICMHTHKTKTLYGVRYGCGKPNGRTKRRVYCQKWVRFKSHKSKAVITKGIHKVEHAHGTKWG